VYVAPSLLVKGGSAPAPAAAAAGTTQTAATSAPSQTVGDTPTAGIEQAKKAPSLLQRILGIMPVATGLTQALLGFFITNGRVSLAAVPLLSKLPPFLVGSLVAATAMPTLLQGIGKLIGKN
jgi:hypothetical protein